MTDTLSITMLSYHHPEYVTQVAEALDKQEGAVPAYEVILVDNGGCDRSAAIARARGWRVIRPGYNTGYAEGHNLAAQHARGAYLLQMNDDLIPEPGWLAAFWRFRGAAEIIGALQLDPDGRVNHAGGYFDALPWPRHVGRYGTRVAHEGRGVRPADWVTGAALLIRKDVYDALGGLDEVYWYGSEDCDLCIRAILAGHRIGVNTEAVSVHGELGTRAGGAADLPNEQIFRERWQARLPEIRARSSALWAPGRREYV